MANLKDTVVNGDLEVNGAIQSSQVYTELSSNSDQSGVQVQLSPIVLVDLGTISSLPATVYNSNTYYISDDYYPIQLILSNPAAQLGAWVVTTGMTQTDPGYGIRITGNITGSTTVSLVLARTVVLASSS